VIATREVTYPPTALVLCADASVPCEVIERTLADAGFEVVARVRHWSEAVERVTELAVDVAVVDLALTGSVGVRVVPVLRSASPSSRVIAISPLEDIDLALLEAGAAEVVRPSDLRPLSAALRRIACDLEASGLCT
jgi:ActR/RegA family two-component response regulator